MKRVLACLFVVALALGVVGNADATLWLFDEGTGSTASDSSGNGNDGTLMGAAAYSTQTPFAYAGNYSLDLTSGGYVQVPDDPTLDFDGAVPITLEAWIYPIVLGTWDNIVTKGYASTVNYQLASGHSPLKLAFDYYSSGSWRTYQSDADVLTLNQWQHVAAVYDTTGNVTLYVDGSSVAGTGLPSAALTANNLPLGIGAEGNGGGNFSGYIDEVRISDVALSGAQLGAHGSLAPVPEPATMLLMGTGLVGLAGIGRKKLFKKK